MVRARDLVVATNGYTDRALPRLRRRLVPVGSYIIATAPLTPNQAAAILPRRRVLFDTKNYLHYLRLSADDRLIFGGRAQWTMANAASTRTSAAILQRDLARVFPELASVPIDYGWGGNVCMAVDLMPHAGRFDGYHFAVGYGGHGVAMATFLGDWLAAQVAGADRPNPFRDLPLRAVPLYTGRPWFLPAVGAWYRWRDWVG